MKLTQEEKRIKLAKAGGLKVIDIPFTPSQTKAVGCVFTDAAKTEWRKCYPNSFGLYGLPDYFEDLNAVHELVAALCSNSEDGAEFGRFLVQIVLGYDFWAMPVAHQVLNHWELCRLADATAAQRAEALGRTLNLW